MKTLPLLTLCLLPFITLAGCMPVSPMVQLTPSPTVTIAPSQILPTNSIKNTVDPVENRCLKTVPIEKISPDLKGILLGYSIGDRSASFFFNPSSNDRTELQLGPDIAPFDFIVSPDKKSVALSIITTTPPAQTIKLLIVNSAGVTQKEFAWKSDWGRIASWPDNQHILIAKQADLQSSIYNPETIILLDVNSGEDHEIDSTYPDLNQVNYVNWNLINYIYSPDFTRVLYPLSKVNPGYVNYVALWDMVNKQILATLPVELSATSLPKWSPEGTQVLITGLVSKVGEKSSTWPGQELFTIDTNGNINQLTHFTDYYPGHITINHYSWSPDGKSIAFWLQIGRLQVPQLVVLNIDSGKVINYCISGLPYNKTAKPVWSPAGNYLVVDYQKSENDVFQSLLINVTQETIAPIADNIHVIDWLVSP
ncbi:MAG: hypothetical protein HZB50_03890 [Chloroflexi bacterium]|nr:hypothetical protein [Chloroflexota bacterium]